MTLPARFKTHTVTVEPYEGVTPYGDAYGAGVEVECRVEDEIKLVRTASGEEVASATTIYCDRSVNIPTESRVTIGSRVATVLTVADHDTAGQSALEHKEIALT